MCRAFFKVSSALLPANQNNLMSDAGVVSQAGGGSGGESNGVGGSGGGSGVGSGDGGETAPPEEDPSATVKDSLL